MPKLFAVLLMMAALGSCNFLKQCNVEQHWEIDKYTIEKQDCRDMARHYDTEYYLYKKEKNVAAEGYEQDSCTIYFQVKNDVCLKFNVCGKTMQKMVPGKQHIDPELVDSIRIYMGNTDISKRLSRKEIKKFIKDWNRAQPVGYNPTAPAESFRHMYNYRLIIYTAATRQVLTSSLHVEDESRWQYRFRKDEPVKSYFDALWGL